MSEKEILEALRRPAGEVNAKINSGKARQRADELTMRLQIQGVDITYVREPFSREPDFGVTSVKYRLSELLSRGGPPG